VPLEGTITFQDLATRSKVPLASLKTVARMVMTARILCEPEREHVQHTAASALLAKSRPLHDWALIMGLEPVDIAMKMVEATEKWPGSTKTNETAFNVALDTDLAFFKHLQTRPDHLHKYTEYQRAVASTEGLDLRHVVNGYDWAALDTATVVDVCVPILWS
jgi:6-hydroxytryprostatin B O-methyltransferase